MAKDFLVRQHKPEDYFDTHMDTRRRSPWVWGAVTALMVVVAYPLSLGPVCWLVEKRQISPALAVSIYVPLVKMNYEDLRGQPSWRGGPIDKYASLWSKSGWDAVLSEWLWFQ